MAKRQTGSSEKKIRPALTPEARESQLISLATDLAEKQLIEGTASSQVITHYLKLGSSKYKAERDKLQEEVQLLRAKTESLQSAKRSEEMFEEAIKAFKGYQPSPDEDYYDQDV